MSELANKLEVMEKLHGELTKLQETMSAKAQMQEDLMKDLATKHLGFSDNDKQLPLSELMLRLYRKAKAGD